MEHVFRAYDVRGVFNRELTSESASGIGMAFGTYLKGRGKVLVARDGRTSSRIFEGAFLSGVASTGSDCVSIGLVPIPVANFEVWRRGYAAGSYVTASHNPPEYNGVRFRRSDGSGYTLENQEVAKIFSKRNFKLAGWNKLGSIETVDSEEAMRRYSNFLLSEFDFGRKLKVVLDTGNGVTSLTAPDMLRKAGFEVSVINPDIDGTFPGRPSEPSDGTLHELKKAVISKKAHFGAGYDGDGDRVIFVDDRGRAVHTEKAGVMLAKDALERKRGKIVANVSCSMMVEREVEKHGGKVVRVRVGDVFVCEAIKRHKALFGMEASAHYFMPDFYIFDDPVLATLKLSRILSETGAKLSEMADELKSYPQKVKNFPCSDKVKFSMMRKIVRSLKAEGYKLDLTDGAKIIFEDGWILIRPSNTTPLIRVSIEAETEHRVAELTEFANARIKKAKK